MKYYKLKFMSTYGLSIEGHYTNSKDGKKKLKLDYNRECIIPEHEIGDYTSEYDTYSIEYIGKIPEVELIY